MLSVICFSDDITVYVNPCVHLVKLNYLSKPAVGRFGIERHPYTESCIDQLPCVCVYDYSSQTTGPICIKITVVDRTYHDECYRLVRFELFTTSPLKFI